MISAAQQAGERLASTSTGPIEIAIVLGTGLGSVAAAVDDGTVIPYGDLPGFPAAGVSGHAGRAVCGMLGGRRVVVLQGRAHYYEHGRADAMRGVIAALAVAGCGRILLTNSAGSLVPTVGPGRLMLITDHLNLSGANPLFGDREDARFVDMVDAYDPAMRADLKTAAAVEGIELAEGVYAWFSGPSFETPAEIRAARMLGADAVGMSTAPEVILARRFGLKAAAVSMITNLGAGMDKSTISHEHTKAVAAVAAADMERLMVRFLSGRRGGTIP